MNDKVQSIVTQITHALALLNNNIPLAYEEISKIDSINRRLSLASGVGQVSIGMTYDILILTATITEVYSLMAKFEEYCLPVELVGYIDLHVSELNKLREELSDDKIFIQLLDNIDARLKIYKENLLPKDSNGNQ